MATAEFAIRNAPKPRPPSNARAAPATTLWRSFQDRMPRIMTALPIAVLPAWSGGRCRPVAGRKEPRLLYRCGDRFSRGVSETTLCLPPRQTHSRNRSEEHTSELQSRLHLVCRLLLEKKKDNYLLPFAQPHGLHPLPCVQSPTSLHADGHSAFDAALRSVL